MACQSPYLGEIQRAQLPDGFVSMLFLAKAITLCVACADVAVVTVGARTVPFISDIKSQ